MNKKAYLKGYIKGLNLVKKAGPISEIAGASVNPLTMPSIPFAAIIAALTKSRTPVEQLKHDKSKGSSIADILIPGKAPYNFFKRVGVKDKL